MYPKIPLFSKRFKKYQNKYLAILALKIEYKM